MSITQIMHTLFIFKYICILYILEVMFRKSSYEACIGVEFSTRVSMSLERIAAHGQSHKLFHKYQPRLNHLLSQLPTPLPSQLPAPSLHNLPHLSNRINQHLQKKYCFKDSVTLV